MNCYSCQTSNGEHFKWCIEDMPVKATKIPIDIPIVPKDAVVPHVSTDPSFDTICVPGLTYTTKDSGKREEFTSGMVRDIQTDKPRYDLIGWGWKLIQRWAELVGRGAVKYGELNFEKANSKEEMLRFRASAIRHAVQWFNGEKDEDHAAAVCFNIAGYEAVKEKLYGSGK